jgi:hypothetical protein
MRAGDLHILTVVRAAKGDRREAAERLRTKIDNVYAALKRCGAAGYKIPVTPANVSTERAYEPSAEEIAAKTAEMRKTWNSYERWRRSGGLDGSNSEFPLETQEVSRLELGAAATYLRNPS